METSVGGQWGQANEVNRGSRNKPEFQKRRGEFGGVSLYRRVIWDLGPLLGLVESDNG